MIATIYTTLLRFKEAALAMGHSFIPKCFDMSLLTNVLEIVWVYPNGLSGVMLMEVRINFLISAFSEIDFSIWRCGAKIPPTIFWCIYCKYDITNIKR